MSKGVCRGCRGRWSYGLRGRGGQLELRGLPDRTMAAGAGGDTDSGSPPEMRMYGLYGRAYSMTLRSSYSTMSVAPSDWSRGSRVGTSPFFTAILTA